jgi:dimethylhistidine N-methyltransferase
MIDEVQSHASDRLTLHRLAEAGANDTFAGDVRRGLTARPKALPPKYFYDELGSHLFEAICRLPEYYLTRAETEILTRHADETVARLPAPVTLIELGSGSATKTRFLIEAVLRRQAELHYRPIDISPTALETSARELLDAYAGLTVSGYAGDYDGALRQIAAEQAAGPRRGSTLVLFLGSNIGNFTPEEATLFLRQVRGVLRPGDGLLLGADLKKDRATLEAAYDDALGVTAAFNLNLLLRINRELGGEFELTRFRHRAVYDEEFGRVEMHLESRTAQRVPIRGLDLAVDFAAGETIHTENSYKFDLPQLAGLAAASGFALTQTWHDQAGRFSFSLLLAEVVQTYGL